jgi:hypothetical protein
MIRGDQALISRLVIIEFKPKAQFEWGSIPDSFMKNPNFAYSFKHYLETDYVIPDSFTPCRYEGADKYEFIARALNQNKTTVDEWLEFINVSDGILHNGKFKRVDYKYIVKNEAYPHYERNTRSGAEHFKKQNFIKMLLDKGFTELKTHINLADVVILRIESTKWDELMESYGSADVFEEMDHDDDF